MLTKNPSTSDFSHTPNRKQLEALQNSIRLILSKTPITPASEPHPLPQTTSNRL